MPKDRPIADLLESPFLTLRSSQSALPSIYHFASLKRQDDASLVWIKSANHYESMSKGLVILSCEDYDRLEEEGRLVSEVIHFTVQEVTPRMAFIKLLNEAHEVKVDEVNYADVHRSRGIQIFEGAFIGADVEIGEGTVIYPNVVVHEGVRIGKRCTIREHACLGTYGMGFEKDDSGHWIRFPQIGGLVIGNDVEIGSHSDIKRAALDDTVVGDHCKLGSYVNIGHNCIVGDHALFTVRCIVGGSSVIGRHFFMGMNASIKNGVNVGDNVTLGAHSFLNRDALSDGTYIGTPARRISDNKT